MLRFSGNFSTTFFMDSKTTMKEIVSLSKPLKDMSNEQVLLGMNWSDYLKVMTSPKHELARVA